MSNWDYRLNTKEKIKLVFSLPSDNLPKRIFRANKIAYILLMPLNLVYYFVNIIDNITHWEECKNTYLKREVLIFNEYE